MVARRYPCDAALPRLEQPLDDRATGELELILRARPEGGAGPLTSEEGRGAGNPVSEGCQRATRALMESLILAQDKRWRRA